MLSRKKIDEHVATLPDFAFNDIGRTNITHSPSQVFTEGEDHEVDLALRTGRALQHKFGARLDNGEAISPGQLNEAMDSVAYVPVTEFVYATVLLILTTHWKYWYLLP